MTGIDTDRWLRLWAHRDDLYRLALRRLGNHHDAYDVVAEAVLRAATAPHVDLDRAGAWMNTVVRNPCADRYRAQCHCAAARRYAVRETIPAPSPEDEVCERLAAARLRHDVTALPERQRRAVELLAGGLDVGGVASALGAPYKAAESLLGRARRSLRAAV